MVCREYLVTSPAECCSRPTRETVATVPVPASVHRAMGWLTAVGEERPSSVPLIVAPHWAETHPEPAPSHTGVELARELFQRLMGSPPGTGQPAPE
jgi:hypothetical protein